MYRKWNNLLKVEKVVSSSQGVMFAQIWFLYYMYDSVQVVNRIASNLFHVDIFSLK